MTDCDVLVIGAGLLGCFTARALSAYELKIVVLEEREDVCTGISRANSGIIYTGLDAAPGTLKAELCVRANKDFDRLCAELDVPFRRCGSLMIACGSRGEAKLRQRYEQGLQNGVEGLRLLEPAQVREMESELTEDVTLALYAPGTGTVDPWALGIAAYENACHNGAEFRFSEGVRHMERRDGGFLIETEKESYRARAVVNAAGLRADGIRELTEPPLLRLSPRAADYYVTDTTEGDRVGHVIFHESEEKGKGLTVIPTVGGNLLLGPTNRDWNGEEGMPTSVDGLRELRELCARVLPELELSSVIRSFGALRPNIETGRMENGAWIPTGESVNGFSLTDEEGLFSLIGIKTPGLTCAHELGVLTAEKAAAWLGGAAKKKDYDPVRRGIPRVRELSEEERTALIARNPDYGRIVCQCREISRGEILESIRRGAVTVDGVKRRVGAGMGRCQGSRCMHTVLELLARETGRDIREICKDGPGTEIITGKRT